MMHHALIVDDEPHILELLSLTISRMGIACDTADSLARAFELLKSKTYRLCLTDMALGDGQGLDLVKHIAAHHSTTPVVVITAHGSMENAIAALKAGAFDYLNKPVGVEALRAIVKSLLNLAQNNSKNVEHKLIGHSAKMENVRRMIGVIARTQAPVYIFGESGTGKELAARSIHELGPRADKNFVPVNCGAIPETLVESEFFGYCKGAFTGATSDREGFFQTASGGTLFLDEVADLPLQMQVKLLRALQERKVRRVGGMKEEAVDVRIISATNVNLKELVEEKKFRQDLYFRLNVIELPMPPLRDHLEDLGVLIASLSQRMKDQQALPHANLDAKALEALRHHDFPGNVRELENILERAMAFSTDGRITRESLQLNLPPTDDETIDAPEPRENQGSLQNHLDDEERKIIQDALKKSNNNRAAAARLLGVTHRSLRYRMERLGIKVED